MRVNIYATISSMTSSKLPRFKTLWPTLIVLALVSGCSQNDSHRPNVVVIVVDTLRVDRLPFYGCPQNTAPFLSELAQRSLVFENAWSPSSWTLPATVSILTSVHPFQHGVGNLDGLELEPEEEPIPVNCIPEEIETLAETLQDTGYRTFGIVSNVLVGSEVGFDRGFDYFVKLEDKDADIVNAQAADWSDKMLDASPFFLYVHYFDPHDTFHAREPWFDLSDSDLKNGWPEGIPQDVQKADSDLDWVLKHLDPGPEWLGNRPAKDLSLDELQSTMDWIRAAYDSEISFVDSRIRALFEMLKMDEAIVFFLADHGEEFYEHGAITHGQNLYGETVRVPLMLSLPGKGTPRGRVKTHVTTLDVIPTLRRLLDLPPSIQDQGRDLLAETNERPVLGTLEAQHPQEEDLRSIVLRNYRLIAPESGAPELFDLALDPWEQHNLADDKPDLVAELLQRLEQAEKAAPRYRRVKRIPEPPSEAMREHLKGIGYLGDE